MFLGSSRDKLILDYPILGAGEKGDFILVYLSLDGMPTIPSHIALFQNNVEFQDYLLEYCSQDENWESKISLGQILIRPADEKFDKNLLIVFVKESFYNAISIDHIKTGINKLCKIYKKYGIETISIDNSLFDEGIFDDLMGNEELPKINIY